MTIAEEKSGATSSIDLDDLIRLHEHGFKLVPLDEDSQPAISWTSVYENPAYWTSKRLSNDSYKFKNLATCFGKTHLKDEKGELYLNCLDIDSQEAYNRLLNLANGEKTYSLLEVAQKTTYLTKTKKGYGYHIYWLSHQQNKPIHTTDCKQGHEFEIKTDKSGGLATLPPSKHRDDAEFHYKNFGLDSKVVVSDKIYDEIKEVLVDCLKPLLEDQTRSCNNTRDNTELSNENVKIICEALFPCYKKGRRNDLIFALSGLLRKSGVSHDSALEIIQTLAKDDEEKRSRIVTLEDAFKKDPREVCGTKYFLETIESLAPSNAREVFDKIIRIIGNGSNTILWLTNMIINEHIFKTMRDTSEIYYYDENRGLYIPGGNRLIEECCQSLYPEVTTRIVSEVVNQINRRTGADRCEFDSNLDVINLENGLLNIHTLEFRKHSPTELSLAQLPISYDPKATCPNTLRFLGEVLKPKDVFTALELFGYCLYRTSKFQKALLCVGKGANGKSTFLSLFDHFLGKRNTGHISLQDVMNNRFASAGLYSKLANIFADLKNDRLTNSGPFKMLVSGDTMKAEKKHCQPFELENYAKLIFSANEIPQSEDKTYAYFRRWIIFFFGQDQPSRKCQVY